MLRPVRKDFVSPKTGSILEKKPLGVCRRRTGKVDRRTGLGRKKKVGCEC